MLRFVHHLPPGPSKEKQRLIFVDRDGVINVDPIGDYVKSRKDFTFEAGAIEALQLLVKKGYQIIIISNQAGIGDGVYTESDLQDIHTHMIDALEKNHIPVRSAHYCLHGKQAGCSCRKPQTGLFEDATKNIVFSKSETYFIGDKNTDVEAGKRFGIKTIFVRTGHGPYDEAKLKAPYLPDLIAENILDAVEKLPQ